MINDANYMGEKLGAVNIVRPTRYAELDALRGGAILSVLLFHYTTRYDEIYGYGNMPFSFPLGYLGIYLFYMISGFVVYMSLENTKSSLDFISRRFSRLYPAYWVSIGITFFAVSLFSLPGRESTIYDLIINLTMLQDWIGGVRYIDGAYWTLSRFIAFYFIIFAIYKLKQNNNIVRICLFWLLIIIVTKAAAGLGVKIPSRVKLTFLLSEGSFFIIGMMFFLLTRNGSRSSAYSVIILSLISIFYINDKPIFFASLFFVMLFILFSNGRLRFLNNRPLISLGEISYCLYLLHQNIGYIIIRKLSDYHANFLISLLIPTIVSLLLATIITYYVERPILLLLRAR